MKNNRKNAILEILAKESKAEVTVLSDLLGVSQVTIRKDLAELEKEGIIIREHGFAILSNADDINGRIAYHYEEKLKIAKCAASYVSDSDTIMIESGSCCALLADELCSTKQNLTIITNSAFIANYIRRKSSFQIILLGGIYQQESQAMVGPMVRQCAENFLVDNYFIGTDGYDSRIGFTNNDQLRAQAVRDMARQASQVIVLTESEKFRKHGSVPLNLKDAVKIVITDQNIGGDERKELESKGIQVIISE